MPLVGLTNHLNIEWNTIRIQAEEQEPNQIKNVVNPSNYEKVEVALERTFYLEKTMSWKGKEDYVELLKEYPDVFAWAPLDL